MDIKGDIRSLDYSSHVFITAILVFPVYWNMPKESAFHDGYSQNKALLPLEPFSSTKVSRSAY